MTDDSQLATQPAARPAHLLPRGASVGRYLVTGVLGRGGMGVVYAAYDPELDRKVAVKLLRADVPGLDRSALLGEARAIARLQHPNVVAVHDVGTHDDELFVAMEYVDGQSLAEWRQGQGWRELLAVSVQAGRGLEAAHAAGVVHRDFKPANVLVGKDGRARVGDFGLARLGGGAADNTSPTSAGLSLLTTSGSIVGTPAYMSPEQASGKPTDAAGDQFSFAVSLWEGLYGERPFSGASPTELPIAAGARRLPASRDARIPAFVRAALARALSLEPAARWPSMTELLAALGRDPARARRRVVLGAGVIALLAAAVLGTRALLGAPAGPAPCSGSEQRLAGVWDAAARQRVQAAFLATEKPFAADSYARAAGVLDEHTAGWVAMRADACRATRIIGEQSEEVLGLRMACLDQRLGEVRALVAVLAAGGPEVVENAGKAVESLPRLDACADVEALTAVVRPPADPAARARVAAVRGQLADAEALVEAGKGKQGLAAAREVAAAARELGHPPLLADALLLYGAAQDQAGDGQGAAASLYDAAYAGEVGRHDQAAAQAWTLLAGNAAERARLDEAERLARQAEATLLRIHDPPPMRQRYEMTLSRIALAGEKLDDALLHAERARAMALQVFGDGDPRTARAGVNVGEMLYHKGNYAEARQEFLAALAVLERTVGPHHPSLASTLGNLGAAEAKMDDYEAGLGRHRRALAILEEAYGPGSPELVNPLNNLAGLLAARRRFDEALALDERALALLGESRGPDHPKVGIMHLNIGNLYSSMGEIDQALAHLDMGQKIIEKSMGPDSINVAQALKLKGFLYTEQGRLAEGEAALRRALAILEKAVGREHRDVGLALTSLGRVLLDRRRPREALACFRRALDIERKTFGEESVTLIPDLAGMGQAQLRLGQRGQALPILARAAVLAEATQIRDSELLFTLARELWAWPAQRERATALARRARSLMPDTPRHQAARVAVDRWLERHR